MEGRERKRGKSVQERERRLKVKRVERETKGRVDKN